METLLIVAGLLLATSLTIRLIFWGVERLFPDMKHFVPIMGSSPVYLMVLFVSADWSEYPIPARYWALYYYWPVLLGKALFETIVGYVSVSVLSEIVGGVAVLVYGVLLLKATVLFVTRFPSPWPLRISLIGGFGPFVLLLAELVIRWLLAFRG